MFVHSVEVELGMADAELLLTFRVTPGAGLALPQAARPTRTDGLWRRTCFEMFVMKAGSDAYREFNFSPSTQWAAYHFIGYRADMATLDMPAIPRIETTYEGGAFVLTADLRFASRLGLSRMGLSAVIEERDGTKSYWALRHPPGAPDFHHPDCFALDLPVL